MADVDWGQVEQQLKSKAGQWYDSSMLGDVQRNVSYGAGNEVNQSSVDDWVNRVGSKALLRGNNEVNSTYVADNSPSHPGGYMVPPGGSGGSGPQNVAQQWNASSAPAVDPALKAKSDALYNQLLTRANQGLNVDRNTPGIRMQADAYSANAERAKRNYLSDTAEGSSPFANLTGETRMANERVGQQTGAFEADLVGRELQAKRDEIQNALNGMAGMLDTGQRLDLQGKLATMDNALGQRRLSLDEKTQSSASDLGLRRLGLDDWQQRMYWDAVNSGRM